MMYRINGYLVRALNDFAKLILAGSIDPRHCHRARIPTGDLRKYRSRRRREVWRSARGDRD